MVYVIRMKIIKLFEDTFQYWIQEQQKNPSKFCI